MAPYSPLMRGAQYARVLTFYVGGGVETKFELRTTYFDTMINDHLSQKLKQLGNDEFNYLIIILRKL